MLILTDTDNIPTSHTLLIVYGLHESRILARQCRYEFSPSPTIYEHDECLIQRLWHVIVKKSPCTVLPFDLLVVPGTDLAHISQGRRFISGTVC